MTEDRRANSWHGSKGLSISHILSTVVLAVGFFTYLVGIEKDTVINAAEIKNLSERMTRTDQRHSEQFSEIKELLKSLTVKIDNLNRG